MDTMHTTEVVQPNTAAPHRGTRSRPRAPSPAARAAALAGLLLLSGGCGSERLEAELASDLYTNPLRVEAARVVDAGALPDAGAGRPIGEARRVFSIGRRDGDERYVFGKISDVATSASGDTVYVADAMNREIKAFSRRGEFLFRFGGRGEGPGEFEDPVSVASVPWNGGVAVWDANLQRVTVVSAAGEVLHTSSPIRQSDIARQGRRLRAHDGGFLLEVRSDPYTVPIERQRGHLVRLDTAGEVRDTLVDFAVPWEHGTTQQGSAGLISTLRLTAPRFTPNPAWDAAPGAHVALVPGGRYELFRIDERGAAPLRVTRPWTPARVTRKERTINLGHQQERGELSPRVPMFVLELVHRRIRTFAVARPSLAGALVDERGAVWAQRFDVRDEPWGRSRTWDGYAPDGTSAGSVRFEPGFLPLALRAGTVYGIRRDALGVDRLEAYRL